MLSVIHRLAKSGSNYANISSVATLPKGLEAPKQINENFEFNFDNKFNKDVLEKLPDFIKDKIKTSNEYKQIETPEVHNMDDINAEMQIASQEESDDLPF